MRGFINFILIFFFKQHETVELQSEFFELMNLAQGEEVIFILLEAPLHGTITREAEGNSYLFTEGDC